MSVQTKDSPLSDNAENKISELSTSFVTWDKVLDILKISVRGWQIALTGGLAIVTAFLPEIINFSKEFLQAKMRLVP